MSNTPDKVWAINHANEEVHHEKKDYTHQRGINRFCYGIGR